MDSGCSECRRSGRRWLYADSIRRGRRRSEAAKARASSPRARCFVAAHPEAFAHPQAIDAGPGGRAGHGGNCAP